MRIAVVGSGTAGTATALLLARQGHRISLYERVPAPAAVGAGILLQPTGQAVLAELGLARRVLEASCPVARLRCQTVSGRNLFCLPYEELGAGTRGYGVHRGALFEALFQAAAAEAAIEIECGVEVTTLEHVVTGIRLRHQGGMLGTFDLAVIADGAGSRLRQSVPVRQRVWQYPWGAIWVVAPDPGRTFAGELLQVVDGTQQMIGMLPTGSPDGISGDHVSLFWSVRLSTLDSSRAQGVGNWKAAARRMLPAAEPVLEHLRDDDQLLVARYHDVQMPRWHADRVVILGDAAHAMSPQLGQGANLALVDASTLASCLRTHASLADALASYSRLRRRQVEYYQWASRMLTPFFQSDRTWLGRARDVGMPLATRVPVLRERMIMSMAGLGRGLTRAALPLPVPALPPPPREARLDP